MDRNEKVCNLVLLTNDDTQHFILVNDFSRLLQNGKRIYCTQSLDGSFITEEALKTHQNSCFKNEGNKFKHFYCCMDFEVTLKPIAFMMNIVEINWYLNIWYLT
jgi:hypothetical protein